jgi:DNA replication protein
MNFTFDGFNKTENTFIEIPESFISKFLPIANSIGEVKLILYFYWIQEKSGDKFNGLTIENLIADEILLTYFKINIKEPTKLITKALQDLISNLAMLKHSFEYNGISSDYYFINNDKGRLSAQSLLNGNWHPGNQSNFPIHLVMVTPNIFKLYEENIGPITPILSESLEDAENEYPNEWISEAFKIAIENNVRKWKYIEAVLKRWKEEGKNERTNQKDVKDRTRKYSGGDDAEFFED